MPELGLKLWSTNLVNDALLNKLFTEHVFDYIEIYVVPGSKDKHLSVWANYNLPYVLHAPHSYSGLNMSLPECECANRALIEETDTFRMALSPRHVIFHPGLNGSLDETIRQLLLFKKEYPVLFDLALIENKPRVGLKGEDLVGSSPDEIRRIMDETGIGFCLDIGHAINYSAWANLMYDDVLDQFICFNPKMYHLSDGDDTSARDSHLNFGKGNFDLSRIIKKIPFDAHVTLETAKDLSLDLADFEKDVRYFRNEYDS